MKCWIVLLVPWLVAGCGVDATQGRPVWEPVPAACSAEKAVVRSSPGDGTARPELPSNSDKSAKVAPSIGIAGWPAPSATLAAPAAVIEAPQNPEFPERQSVEALDRLARTVPVERGRRGSVIRLGVDDLFEPGGTAIRGSARWRLEDIAVALKAQARRRISIRAYTDALGDRAESVRLSLRRANTLLDYFASQGVPADGMRPEGPGPDHPIADNDTPAGRADNRRVEIVIETPPVQGPR